MSPSPTRTVENNVLVSTDLPPLSIEIDANMEYAGRLQFDLYNVADADIFVFAEAGADRKIKRWFIVQFEAYLPNNNYTYDYTAEDKITLGDYEYMFDDFVTDLRTTPEPPGSDAERVLNLLEQNGYLLPEQYIRVRYARPIDAARRREVLIIYLEDLQALGFSASDLSTDGTLSPASEVAMDLNERALSAFTILKG